MSTRMAGDILKELLASLKISDRPLTLYEAWPGMVGDETSEHLKIKDIKGNVLSLVADHPGWIQVAQLRKKEILDKIKEKFPDKKIESIKVSLR